MTTKIGIIGAGAIARYAFLPGFAAPGSANAQKAMRDWYHNGCPDAQVVAIASRTRSQAEQLAQEFGVRRVYSDWRSLFWDPDVEAVCVATPNDKHFEMTVAACEAGKHVLVEKPLAMTLIQGRTMVAAAARAKVILMVQQNQRFFPVHEVAKQILDAGLLGHVHSLRARWSHAGPEFWSPQGTWFFDSSRAGHGALFDLGIHKFDLIRYLTGKEAAEVSAFTGTLEKKIEVEDNGAALIRFTDGAFGVVEASWSSAPNENSIRLYGTHGYLQVGTDSSYPLSVHFGERPQDETRFPAGKWSQSVSGDHVFVPHVPSTSATGGMFRHFADCIRKGRPNIASGKDNLKSFELCLAAFESAKRGCAVALPL